MKPINERCGGLNPEEPSRLKSLKRKGPSDLLIKRFPRKSLVGKRFGRLRVKSYMGFSKSCCASYWLCVCDCGRFVAVSQKSICKKIKPTQSCGCLAAFMASSRGWKGCGLLSRNYWNHISYRAMDRNIPFQVSIEECWDLFVKQNGRCALSGLEITLGRFRPAGIKGYARIPRLGTASLDRVDSTKGYISGNVQWLHKRINQMKGNQSDADFIKMCSMVVKHNRKK